MNKTNIAFFDFDGTISIKDTFIAFILFYTQKHHKRLKLLFFCPYFFIMLLLYLAKIINNHQIKQKIMTVILANTDQTQIQQTATQFVNIKLNKYIKPKILNLITKHQNQQHQVIIVSANLEIFLNHWADKHNINKVIATKLEVTADKITGKILGQNCYGLEKVNRITDYLQANNLNWQQIYSYGYGDSAGDIHLLNQVDEGYWVYGDVISKYKK